MSDRPPRRRADSPTGRRTVLAGIGAFGASLFAGCNALNSGPVGNGSATNDSTAGNSPSTPVDSETPTQPEQAFEADVVGITGVSNEGRSFTFTPVLAVAEGEQSTRIARWLVESTRGDELASFPIEKEVMGPRFQVSGTAVIPDDVASVVIRGEHVANGFGGYALLIRLEDYAFERVQQGPSRQSFEGFSFDS